MEWVSSWENPRPCRFCGGDDVDGHLFWNCIFPPLVEIRELPKFHGLLEMDKSDWPRCLLWHGWLTLLSGREKAVPRYRRPGRPISVSAVPFGPGTDIWRFCRFIGALFRALRALPGGIGRFLSGDIGAQAVHEAE